MAESRITVGILGFGKVGEYAYQQVLAHPEWGLDIAFAWNRSPEKLAAVPEQLVLAYLGSIANFSCDVVIEASHPDITRNFGDTILQQSDYMPLSLTALADAALEERLISVARTNGTRLLISHGAVTCLDTLEECKDLWTDVSVTMRKPPGSLDFSMSRIPDFENISKETILYDGPTREICARFPRNVNTHAAVALAGIGFDRTRSILIADPTLQSSVLEIKANGPGVSMHLTRTNELKGVSGVMTLRAALGSLLRSSSNSQPLVIC